MKAQEFRTYFPILQTQIGKNPLVYFDNAATSQRPLPVVRALDKMNLECNANIHRAVHTLASQATDAYEAARIAAKDFINAPSREQIIFTSGVTHALNIIASSFGASIISGGDEVIVGLAEHHSNMVPWQMICLQKGAKIVYLKPSEEDGSYRPEDLEKLITPRTRLIALTQASNILGVLNPVKELVKTAHTHGIPVVVDGAQGIVHTKVDVQDMDCDFYAFSLHKVFGPTGVGILYGKKEYLEKMPPLFFGGEMVGTVSLDPAKTTFAPLPMKFEAGTQNIANSAAAKSAFEFADKALSDKELNEELEQNTRFLCEELEKIEGLTLYGPFSQRKLPIFSFSIKGVHHEDLAILLDKMGVAVRSGQMCAEPLVESLGQTGVLRASLLPYNTKQEAEYFIKCLNRAIAMLK